MDPKYSYYYSTIDPRAALEGRHTSQMLISRIGQVGTLWRRPSGFVCVCVCVCISKTFRTEAFLGFTNLLMGTYLGRYLAVINSG